MDDWSNFTPDEQLRAWAMQMAFHISNSLSTGPDGVQAIADKMVNYVRTGDMDTPPS